MRRHVTLIAALAIAASACAGASPGSTEQAPATAAASSSGETRAAPAFTLALAEGGEYVLSEDANPVYMIFWAEW